MHRVLPIAGTIQETEKVQQGEPWDQLQIDLAHKLALVDFSGRCELCTDSVQVQQSPSRQRYAPSPGRDLAIHLERRMVER